MLEALRPDFVGAASQASSAGQSSRAIKCTKVEVSQAPCKVPQPSRDPLCVFQEETQTPGTLTGVARFKRRPVKRTNVSEPPERPGHAHLTALAEPDVKALELWINLCSMWIGTI